MSQMMVIQNPQNVHKIYFQLILMTFKVMSKLTSICVNLIWSNRILLTSSLVHLASF